MRRSEINRSIRLAKRVFTEVGLHLPPFACWTAEEWESKGAEVDSIRRNMLGWDVTDFGGGRFLELGRILFTLRNGRYTDTETGKVHGYAEKFILDPPNQKPPLHYHASKMEDIINRGGGNILIRLYASTPDGQCSEEDFDVVVDGEVRNISAGTVIRLEPGQSICLPPRLIHQFWGEEGTGIVIDGTGYTVSGEVSTICDDWNDNCFLEPVQRFPVIEEDEPRSHYLCHEYPKTTD